jgi:hypothetical protein
LNTINSNLGSNVARLLATGSLYLKFADDSNGLTNSQSYTFLSPYNMAITNVSICVSNISSVVSGNRFALFDISKSTAPSYGAFTSMFSSGRFPNVHVTNNQSNNGIGVTFATTPYPVNRFDRLRIRVINFPGRFQNPNVYGAAVNILFNYT